MPLEPQRASNPEGKYNLTVVIPGWLKNRIVEHCASLGLSIGEWVSTRLMLDIREERGLPAPPPAVKGIPDATDVVREWLTGERMIQPCGKTDCNPEWEELQKMKFCTKCGVRGL
jgi:hypothetical protein